MPIQTPPRRLRAEPLEARILLSATWVDADGADQPEATDGDDTFNGDALANIANGGEGDDRLFGGAGDDQLFGGAGDDTLQGGAGNDLLQGGAGNDTASYSDSRQGVRVDLSAGSATGRSIGVDQLSEIENVVGSNAGDTLIGDAQDNRLSGAAGNDTLEGGEGDDTLEGGTGRDTASYSRATSGVSVDLASGVASGGAGNDTLHDIENVSGSRYDDTLSGDQNANRLVGGQGDDTLDGGSGNDTLVGGRGADTLIGGAGSDTASYQDESAGVSVNLQTGQMTGGDGDDTLQQIENLTGSRHADQLVGDDANNCLDGGRGDDQIFAGAGNDTVTGGAGDDTLDGGEGRDTLSYAAAASGVNANLESGQVTGGDGNDQVQNFENLSGSRHADTLVGDNAANELRGGAGNDTLFGAAGDDRLDGGAGNDTLSGGAGDDRLDGGAGNDTLSGGAGDDRLDGGRGTDTASYRDASGGVHVDLDTGRASGADGVDTLRNIENVHGSEHDDRIVGNNAANVLQGGMGDDTLDGGRGNDTLHGGAGSDTLVGGAGRDTASYAQADSAVQVDLTRGVASGGDGDDTLQSIEAAEGSRHDDTFRFERAASGERYDIVGGAGRDTLDLSNVNSSSASFSDGQLTVQLESGGSFEIRHRGIETVRLADGEFTLGSDGRPSGPIQPLPPADAQATASSNTPPNAPADAQATASSNTSPNAPADAQVNPQSNAPSDAPPPSTPEPTPAQSSTKPDSAPSSPASAAPASTAPEASASSASISAPSPAQSTPSATAVNDASPTITQTTTQTTTPNAAPVASEPVAPVTQAAAPAAAPSTPVSATAPTTPNTTIAPPAATGAGTSVGAGPALELSGSVSSAAPSPAISAAGAGTLATSDAAVADTNATANPPRAAAIAESASAGSGETSTVNSVVAAGTDAQDSVDSHADETAADSGSNAAAGANVPRASASGGVAVADTAQAAAARVAAVSNAWTGQEELRVLDPALSMEGVQRVAAFAPDAPTAKIDDLSAARLSVEWGVPRDQQNWAHDLELSLAPGSAEIEIPRGADFASVFSADVIDVELEGAFDTTAPAVESAAPQNSAPEFAQASSAEREVRSSTGGAADAAGLSSSEESQPASSQTSWFAQLWGLLRGRGGTDVDEQMRRNNGRGG